MTTFYFIRHGHDLAPLLPSTKSEVEEAVKDVRLKKAQLIL